MLAPRRADVDSDTNEFLGVCVDEVMRHCIYTPVQFQQHFSEWQGGAAHRQIVSAVPASRVWSFITAEPFWKASPSQERESFLRAQKVTSAALSCAVGLGLVQVRSIIEALGDDLVSSLPQNTVIDGLRQALSHGAAGRPYTIDDLLGAAPMDTLKQLVAPRVLWPKVIAPLAERLALTTAPASTDFLVATSNRGALKALLRSKTGMTMEIDTAELQFDSVPPAAPQEVAPPQEASPRPPALPQQIQGAAPQAGPPPEPKRAGPPALPQQVPPAAPPQAAPPETPQAAAPRAAVKQVTAPQFVAPTPQRAAAAPERTAPAAERADKRPPPMPRGPHNTEKMAQQPRNLRKPPPPTRRKPGS